MSEQTNNIIRFNYSVDPTTTNVLNNPWITYHTDTTQNTVTGVGEAYWRTITFNFTGKAPFSGVFRIKVNENGIPDTSVFESISGDEVTNVSYNNDTLYIDMGVMRNFSTATENTTYTETEPAGTWSYVQSGYVIHYWRTITFNFTGKAPYSGVFRIEVDEDGVPVEPFNFESISGDEVEKLSYGSLTVNIINETLIAAGILSNFPTATENTVYTETDVAGTWSYTASTTTEPGYEYYEVELYVNSDATTFGLGSLNSDEYITSIVFDTYSITSIPDGGVFSYCRNLASVILPNNLEYIGTHTFYYTNISQITLPSTLEEIGTRALYLSNLSITSLATFPPTIYENSINNTTTLTIHETALQAYINSDWADYLVRISTLETPTYDNVLKFNYSEDPTEMLKNLWVNSCTDTSANTIVGVGEHTEPGYMSLGELQKLIDNWTPEQSVNAEKKSKAIDNAGGLSPYLISNGWTSEEVNEFMSIYNEDSSNAYVICYIETDSEDYEDIMKFIETEVIVYDHYEVTLYINSALNTFETTMFADDDNITSVEFDYDVTSIIDDAFNGCENLSSVTLTSTVPPTIGEDTFSLISPNAVLYVPNDSITTYQTSGFGDYFGEIRGTSPVPPTPFRGYGFNRTNMIDIDYLNEIRIRYNR